MRAESQSLVAPVGGLLALFAACAALLLASSSVSPARAAACSNEAIRAEQGSAALSLPDCRAYELTSPGSSPSITVENKLGFGGGKASPGGDAVSYFSRYPAKGSQTSSETWLSRRTAGGWTVEGLEPQLTPSPTTQGICQPRIALSEALDAFLLSAGGELYSSGIGNPDGECGVPQEELVPGEPRGYSNLYLRRGESPYALVNPVPVGVTPGNATYQAASSDLSRVIFSEDAQLTPGSLPGFNLYEWVDGVVRLVGVLPNGEPTLARLGAATENWGDGGGGTIAGLAPVSHAVSADGERVFFEADGNLYLRENAGQAPAVDANCLTTSEPDLACTLQLDRSIGAGSDGGGVFQFASRDGDRVFFTSDHALTFPASAKAGQPDLYEYDVSAKALSNLTTVGSSEAANVRGISGGSDDGSHVYFVARGVLTGSEQNSEGEEAQANQPNLYLVREGTLTYVATLAPWEEGFNFGGKDRNNWWEASVGRLKTAWSPSGKYLLFSSVKALTGFDNAPSEPELCGLGVLACEELFLYDAEAGGISCISCDPAEANPVANTSTGRERQEFRRFGPGPRYAPRVVLDSGQVFFETENPLAARDVNGFQDVYEYRSGGVSLISSGSAVGGSAFVDASANGRDVFFATPEALVRSDGDGGLLSIYDARVDGGFAEPPLPPAPCNGEEACRSPGPAPPSSASATAAFAGPGNIRPRPCKRGKVRRGKRCVKKVKPRHHRHRDAQHRSGGKK